MSTDPRDGAANARHETSVVPVPGSGEHEPMVWQAVCTCGWSWPNRFYRNRAAHDADAHLRRVKRETT